jgi:hypothetical protein
VGNQLESTRQIHIKWSESSDLSDPCPDSALTLGPLHLHLYAVLEGSRGRALGAYPVPDNSAVI